MSTQPKWCYGLQDQVDQPVVVFGVCIVQFVFSKDVFVYRIVLLVCAVVVCVCGYIFVQKLYGW